MSKKKIITENIFEDKHFNSGDGMMTTIWGPPLWHTLHTISFNYPLKPTKEQKEQYYNFYSSTFLVLPCRYCRENMQKHLGEKGISKKIFRNRETLSTWVYELHETVNKSLGKDSGLSYDDVRQRYEAFRSRCINKPEELQKEEIGCTEPLYGVKGKTEIHIVPKTKKGGDAYVIHKKCVISKAI